ncbi:MAG: hypothetical protein AABZ77_08715 [Chloroflexota bacterium]
MPKLASFIGVLLVLLAGLVTGCARGAAQEQGKVSPSPSPSISQSPKNGLVQTSNEGGVTIDVEWRGLKDGSLVFGVVMDTHSGSVDQYDLKRLATLRDSGGKEYRPGSPDIPLGGHHRSGLLTFPISEPSSLGTAKYFELILRDIAGIAERDLKWELN